VRRADLVPNDSCDEYPYAATYQGGTNGGLCADIFPILEEDNTWQMYQDPAAPTVTFNEPCVRGHVPNDKNSEVGLALSALSRGQRVIDLEKYTLLITT
jgi:hypothetical protein